VTKKLDGHTALITGGSAGIGQGIARSFLEAGANVMITSRKAEKCEEAVDALSAEAEQKAWTGRVDWKASHVSDIEQATSVMEATVDRFGSLDILVNNAATNPYYGPTIGVPGDLLDKTYEVNLKAPLQWTQVAWDRWMQHSGGSVINISSIGGYKTSRNNGVYCMLKSSLIHLTTQLGAELGPRVRVNCIAPGLIRTDFARALWEGPRGEAIARSLPAERLGEPDDIGRAAVFLAADADWMTGQTLVIDGGSLIQYDDEPAG
jgi:NAD(P)-dependent dehydrogenase (short-subunit alcohol dehydrogenase family)